MADLLLLSRWLGAIPAFLANRTPVASQPAVHVAFVPTASSIYPDQAWVDLDRQSLRDLGYRVSDLDIKSHPDPVGLLDASDAVFVSGGNVFHLLEVMRRTGFDRLLTDRVQSGLPYLGASAGACVVGADIEPLGLLDDPSEAGALESTAGLGWIDEVIVPHADGIVSGRAVVDDLRARYADRFTLRMLADDQALLVSGDHRSVIPS
ncbi:Type 1 glutamine amidotransferase-like domain-containing protein [Gordonia sp. OPL2]|uniref:Type 1 glutamine amidotransferase-like domain-containing protein n=1 Tax=Gordonia sp. OPL2 TaxID=2486274 RepID=UPI0016560353|nr:Type 1 glutamine amidotransferase-like domain-containing protein [Gordonia sp. OPL2]ROZ85809.1 peptidase S51 [Gordonia sp. OPL2]